MKKSEEIQRLLSQAKARAIQLRQEIADVNDELAKMNAELRNLTGSVWGRSGDIAQLEGELARALRIEADETARRVVWAKPPEYTREADQVVSRVTAKRIYIRRPGAESETYYDLDGTRPSRYCNEVIDLLATFGTTDLTSFQK